MFEGVCSVYTLACKWLHALILTHAYLCVAQHSFGWQTIEVPQGDLTSRSPHGVCVSAPPTLGTAFLVPVARSLKLPNSCKCLRVCVCVCH